MDKNNIFQMVIVSLGAILVLWVFALILNGPDSMKSESIKDYLEKKEAKEKLGNETVKKVEPVVSSVDSSVFRITTNAHDYMIFRNSNSDKTYSWKWYELKEK